MLKYRGRLAVLHLLSFLILALFWAFPDTSDAGFVPQQPVMSIEKLRPGMRGHLLTVLRGTKPVRLPLEIVSIIPQKGSLKNGVLVRMLSAPENTVGGVAQGMSGSPVYVNGKLIGALGMGWNFSDHKMAMVTPIEDMCAIFSWPDAPRRLPGGSRRAAEPGGPVPRAMPLWVGGLSERAVSRLESGLDLPLQSVPYGASGELAVERGKFSPGDSVAVLLAWGDVEVGATGTVTATSKDGRFLAFGHPFLERGAVNFPVARARIHDTIFSRAFPFKLASPTSLAGTLTQDRTAGIGGRTDYFTPSIAATLVFKDADIEGRRTEKNFRVVPDAFFAGKLLEGVFGGLIDDEWGRKGQGTAFVTLRVEGRALERGWTRTNAFFSDGELGPAAVREAALIMETMLMQSFGEIYPIGFRLDVSVTQEPKILSIEDVVVSSDARPGEALEVEVTLRPWRRRPVKKHFELTVPKEASGTCELIVRGGGVSSLPQLALEGGWKSIDSLQRLLAEMDAMDANNELIVELLCDQPPVLDAKSGGKKKTAELLPEEKEFLSETKARRIGEGTLRISRSEYVVDGIMRRMIHLDAGDEE